MKKNLLTPVICLLLSVAANSQLKKITDIRGHWDIAGEQNAGASLQILDSSTIILTYMGKKMNIIDYKIDFTKSPVWFDFSTKDTGSAVMIKSLLQVIGDDMIKWQLFLDEERPSHFSSTKGEMFYLKKARTGITTAAVSN
ncbi:MAG: hypothetical protein H7Y01_01380 [Ferruginibacter sp.]|nr:hypothetical protein [Chitinophagaceae bacterium]